MNQLNQPGDVLSFWFGDTPPDSTTYRQRRKLWFGKKAEFDQAIRDRFLPLYQAAINGDKQEWRETPLSCLALIVLFDQFPRNMFRDEPQAFATDTQALEAAKYAVAHGFHNQLHPVQQIFVYLPFEHSENLSDQQQSLALFKELGNHHPELSDTLDYAQRHYDVIQKFRRFPHRNRILRRSTTPEEAEFLRQPGSSF